MSGQKVTIRFVLAGEGGSDDAFVNHLQQLCLESGADEARGSAPDFRHLKHVGHPVVEKLRAIVALGSSANLFFIHRDSDSSDPEPRHEEIREAAEALGISETCIAVVPVRETEAWLLLDEQEIRRVAGRPNGTARLHLPKPSAVEHRARPKELLQEALSIASELRGRRLENFRKEFPSQRRTLLQNLKTVGPIEQLKAWQRLRTDITAAIGRLRRAGAQPGPNHEPRRLR